LKAKLFTAKASKENESANAYHALISDILPSSDTSVYRFKHFDIPSQKEMTYLEINKTLCQQMIG
jgi:hypothetical protein